MESRVHETTDQSLETESRVLDTADQTLKSSDSDVRHVVMEDQSLKINRVDTQIGGLENSEPTSVPHSNSGDVITVEPSGGMKDGTKLPVSDILDESGTQIGNTDESMLRMEGRSTNGETLQLGKDVPQLDSNVVHSDYGSNYTAVSRSLGNGFEMGDMVWGKVKSHPWWPGYIFNEAFTSSSVWRTKKDGQVLVAFFGDSSYGWFDLEELVPYEPHFDEKSQQSTSRNFVKAVEESIDEACRRSALGLTCFCRNPNNFRPTKVPGHIAVDVFDYEPGGIYSIDQIQKSRDNFQPERILSFIEKLAAAPRKVTTTLDFMREKASAFACRRAVFEEFDETYAQAFGHRAVRPTVAPPPTVDQSIQARFSGPLVIAESLSGRKSLKKTPKPKEPSKKDRYLFKRRDEPVDLGTSQTGPVNASSSSPVPSEDRQSNPAAGDYFFQKRDQPVLVSDQVEGNAPAREDGPAPSVSKSVPGSAKESVKRKKAGLLKGSAEKSDLVQKKKKRKTIGFEGEISGRLVQVSASPKAESQPSSDVFSGVISDPVPAEKNDGKLEQVLSDLKALAVDPFHGRDRNRPKIARHLFLKFRSLFYVKSSAALPPASADTDNTGSVPPSRPSKPLDPTTKGERKRVPSERQDDIAAKRMKKAASAIKSDKRQQQQHLDGKGKSSSVASNRLPVKKPTPKLRVEEPTFLVMKYPQGTSLPSSAELKARFARFGPMDTSQMRIFYTTNTCRILFLFKEDAESAHRFAFGNKSAFANVRFTLRPQMDNPQTEKPSRAGDETSNSIDPLHQQTPSAVQLKSCLKKPAGDEGGGGGARGARVRFNMAETRAAAATPGLGPSPSPSTGVVKISDPRTNINSSSSLSVVVDVHNNQAETFSKNPLQPPLISPLHNHPSPLVEVSPSQHAYTTRLPPPPPARPPAADISQQMLSLLTKCNDAVSNVKSILGYVPYHPL